MGALDATTGRVHLFSYFGAQFGSLFQQEMCKLYHLASADLESTLEKYPHMCTLFIQRVFL